MQEASVGEEGGSGVDIACYCSFSCKKCLMSEVVNDD